MRKLQKPQLAAIVFALLNIIFYYIGYRLYALDREVIFTWINLIHYITPAQITIIIIFSTLAGFLLSKKEIPEKYHIPLLILISCLVLIPFVGSPQGETDFIMHYDAARQIQENGIFSLSELGYNRPPLIPMIHAIGYRIFGEGYIVSEMISRIFYILLPIAVYLLGSLLFSSKTGFYSFFLTLATPNILSQNHLFMQDIPVTLFTVLTAYACVKALKEKNYVPLYILFFAACISSKLNGLIYAFVTTVPVILFYFWTNRWDKKAVGILIMGVVSLVLFSVILISTYPGTIEIITKKSNSIISKYVSNITSISQAIDTAGFAFQIGFAQLSLIVFGLFGIRKKMTKERLYLLLWISLPILLLWGMRIRYMMPVFPAVSILIASLLDYREKSSRALVISASLIMILIAGYTSPPILKDYDFQNILEVSKFSNENGFERTYVYLRFTHPWMNPDPLVSAIDYYSSSKINYLGCKSERRRSSNRRNYMIPSMYVKEAIACNVSYKVYETTELDSIFETYDEKAFEIHGGIYSYQNPHYVSYHTKSLSDDTGLILVENVNPTFQVYDFWSNFKAKTYSQKYFFGPIGLESKYGIWKSVWFGERQIFMKPPDIGNISTSFTNIPIPENSSLTFSISLRPDTYHPLKGDGVRFIVSAYTDDVEKIFLDRYIDPKNNLGDQGLHHHKFSLEDFYGKNATFVFMTESGPNNSSMYDTAGFGNPAIVYG